MTTKEKILQNLSSKDYVSGEELACVCGISRAAVHKNIASLRQSGYDISAVTNRGYRLENNPDTLDAGIIKKEIIRRGQECSVFVFETIDSTNSEAKRQTAGSDIDRTVFVTEEQTAGRGRMGRVFQSPKKSGVYFSLVYKVSGGIKNPAFLTAAAAVAVVRAVKELYGPQADCKIKWVNDIFLYGKKICGILTEGVTNFETGLIDTAVTGIGINVRNCGFSGELAATAGSIEEILNEKKAEIRKVSRNQLVSAVISKLLQIYDSLSQKESSILTEVMQEYRSSSLLTGLTVTVNPLAGLEGKKWKAKVLDVSDEAELVVQAEDGTVKKLFSGEVSLSSSKIKICNAI